MNKNFKTAQSQKTLVNVADEIKSMKIKIEEEKNVQTEMEENVKTL